MTMKFRFPLVLIGKHVRAETSTGESARALANAIEQAGVAVQWLDSYDDLSALSQHQNRACSFVITLSDAELSGDGVGELIASLCQFVATVRKRNNDIPIFLFGQTRTSQHLPKEILKEMHGFIHMHEDTPDFVSRYILREARAYVEALTPPFFRSLLNYAQDGS